MGSYTVCCVQLLAAVQKAKPELTLHLLRHMQKQQVILAKLCSSTIISLLDHALFQHVPEYDPCVGALTCACRTCRQAASSILHGPVFAGTGREA